MGFGCESSTRSFTFGLGDAELTAAAGARGYFGLIVFRISSTSC